MQHFTSFFENFPKASPDESASDRMTSAIDAQIRTRAIAERVIRDMFASARRGAEERDIDFGLPSPEYLMRLYDQQRGKCALTGFPMFLVPPQADPENTAWTRFKPSVDRVDSNGHYVRDNVQLVCVFANLAKGEADDHDFREMFRVCAENSESAPPTEPAEQEFASSPPVLSRDVRKRAPKRGRGGNRLADDDAVSPGRKAKRAHRESGDGASIGVARKTEFAVPALGKSKCFRDVRRKLDDAFERGDFATESVDPVAMTFASLQLRKQHARAAIDEQIKDYALRVQELKRDFDAAPKYTSAVLVERVDAKLNSVAKTNMNLRFYLALMRCEEYAVYERKWKARREEAPPRKLKVVEDQIQLEKQEIWQGVSNNRKKQFMNFYRLWEEFSFIRYVKNATILNCSFFTRQFNNCRHEFRYFTNLGATRDETATA
ncbi:hypothetical protein CYMTET_47143 [Cymbomonas tetramitiformis]|uniref:Uncharacterized protein n=1 Tax=Cymbomonas tetramitiformis TaxID=36881 RepID=A0AAE0EWX2_9CHLO|nr:hypothetical protein CYMTET_47143 [Cymbomonas tetramitiformis]